MSVAKRLWFSPGGVSLCLLGFQDGGGIHCAVACLFHCDVSLQLAWNTSPRFVGVNRYETKDQ